MKVCILLFLAVFPKNIFGAGSESLHASSAVKILTEHDSSDLKYLLVRRPDGRFEVESLLESGERCSVASEEDVNFYFYSQQNPENATIFNTKEARNIENSHFDIKKQTLFIVHGWRNDYSSLVNKLIKEAALEAYDINVFVVDWSPIAKENYISVFYNIQRVGKYVGEFINDLALNYNYPLSNVKVVGHSLGAHVAGVAGKHTNGSLDYIVGLDPAGPMFFIDNTDNRLCESDAHFVQVIHTCTKILGLNHSIGDADYYPNGGTSQTGCSLMEDLDGSCSHSRSYEYYAESIRESNGFISTNCDSYNEYESGNCEYKEKSRMGGYYVNKRAKGKFYLRTKDVVPYGLDTID